MKNFFKILRESNLDQKRKFEITWIPLSLKKVSQNKLRALKKKICLEENLKRSNIPDFFYLGYSISHEL